MVRGGGEGRGWEEEKGRWGEWERREGEKWERGGRGFGKVELRECKLKCGIMRLYFVIYMYT